MKNIVENDKPIVGKFAKEGDWVSNITLIVN